MGIIVHHRPNLPRSVLGMQVFAYTTINAIYFDIYHKTIKFLQICVTRCVIFTLVSWKMSRRYDKTKYNNSCSVAQSDLCFFLLKNLQFVHKKKKIQKK